MLASEQVVVAMLLPLTQRHSYCQLDDAADVIMAQCYCLPVAMSGKTSREGERERESLASASGQATCPRLSAS